MSKRSSLDRAIEDVDQQIRVLQKTREVLVNQLPKPVLKPTKAQSPTPMART